MWGGRRLVSRRRRLVSFLSPIPVGRVFFPDLAIFGPEITKQGAHTKALLKYVETQKQLSSIVLRGDIQRMPWVRQDPTPVGAANCLRRVRYRAAYGSAALIGFVVQSLKQEQQ